jgi:hypothetical protein
LIATGGSSPPATGHFESNAEWRTDDPYGNVSSWAYGAAYARNQLLSGTTWNRIRAALSYNIGNWPSQPDHIYLGTNTIQLNATTLMIRSNPSLFPMSQTNWTLVPSGSLIFSGGTDDLVTYNSHTLWFDLGEMVILPLNSYWIITMSLYEDEQGIQDAGNWNPSDAAFEWD